MPKKSPGEKSETAQANTRDKILAAALKEFSALGLAGSRVDRIAAAAGVNKAMIYYHFSSKKNLYEECVESFFENVFRQITPVLTDEGDLESQLRATTKIYAERFTEHPEFFRLMARELANPDGRMVEKIARIITHSGLPQGVVARLTESSKSGRLRKVDVQQALISFITMNIGYFLMAPLDDRVWNVRDKAAFMRKRQEAVVDLFLNGVKAR